MNPIIRGAILVLPAADLKEFLNWWIEISGFKETFRDYTAELCGNQPRGSHSAVSYALGNLRTLFQVLVDRFGHLKHVQFLTAKDRLQLIVGQDFSFVLWILKFMLLNVRPNLFCDFSSRQWFCANDFGQVL
jgi:hypothetical protein